MGAAASIKILVPFLKNRQVKSVLDYGAGNLRNSSYLKEMGFEVIVVETPEQLDKIAGKARELNIHCMVSHQAGKWWIYADFAICNFVLNMIREEKERLEIIDNVYRNLKPGGLFLAEVKEKHGLSGVKGLSEQELDDYIKPLGCEKQLVLRRRGLLAVLYRKY